jgi:hypothetical protein
MAWVYTNPISDGSGTTATPITGGGNLTAGTLAWHTGTAGVEADINDNIALSWIGGTTHNNWFHGVQACAFEVIVNDPRSANKTWFEVTGTTGIASITYHAFGLNVSNNGTVTVVMNIPGTGPTNMIVSSSGVVSANTDTHAVIVFNSAAADSNDYIQLYINGSRITPATYNGGSLGGLTLVWNHATNAAFWVGGGTSSAATIDNYVSWFGAATHAPSASEVSDRWDQLALDNDTEPTEGGGTADMDGAVAVAFSVTGGLATTAAAAGASSCAFGADGALATTAALAGTAGCAFTCTAGAASTAAADGSASLAFTATAGLACVAATDGAVACVFAPTAGLACTVAADGSVACSFAPAGALASTAAADGAASCSFTANAGLASTAAADGAAASAFSATAGLAGTVALDGTSSPTFTVAGGLGVIGTAAMDGAAALAFTVSAGLATTAATDGASACTFTATAAAVWFHPTDGAIACAFACSAGAASTAALACASALTTTASGGLSSIAAMGGTVALAFTAAATTGSAVPDTEPIITAWASDALTAPIITNWAGAALPPVVTSWAA